jgi:serine/threonine protein kinase
MSRKKPTLAPLTVSQGGNSSFSLSDTGSFAQDNVVLSSNGMQSPLSGGEVSGLRLDDLEPGALIGRGASSRVYCAVHRPTGKLLALKVLQEDIESSRESRHMVLNEIKTVFGAGSDHLVTFYDAFLHNGAVYLALEYMDCGSLEGLLRVAAAGEPTGTIPEGVLAAILFQALQGLIYLHREKRSVHRDLKPANILLDGRGFVKLSDFGITKELGSGTYAQAGTHVGTLAYMSPERVRGEPYDFASDIWSLGLIALEAALGRYPYAGAKNVFDIGQMIASGPLPTERPEVQCAVPSDLLELVHSCLCREPQRRPNVSQLMQFPFFHRHLGAPVDLCAYMRTMQPSLQQHAHGQTPSS